MGPPARPPAIATSTSPPRLCARRLCPLGGERNMMGLGRPPVPMGQQDPDTPTMVTETDDLRATKLAFILGRRSAEIAGVAGKALRDKNGDALVDGAADDASMIDYGFQLVINNNFAPGVPGTERFQKLCSFEYLQRYFTNVLCNKGIELGAFPATEEERAADPVWESGPMRAAVSAATARKALRALRGSNPNAVGADINAALDSGSMTNVPDLCKSLGMAGSEAAGAAARLQGIFARDQGPFLRGKGVETGLLMGTPSGTTFGVAVGNSGETKQTQPFHVSRCAGDELAFGMLERLLEQKGLTDWRPDGIVLSLGVDDPSDTLSNEQLQSRDGQLFNVRVQGPAIGSSWTGDPALETMPLDKVFVVIVADVWWGELNDDSLGDFVNKVTTGTQPTLNELQAYLAGRAEELSGDNLVNADTLESDFRKKASDAMNGKPEKTRLCNFRVRLATSSQMINYSGLRFGRDKAQVLGNEQMSRDEFVRVPNQSRMGLRLGKNGAEYIVGGWCIGNVLDTSASRGAMPGTGANIGVRTAPNSMALNINVQIDWWDADRMWRCFMNKEATRTSGVRSGSLTPRYVAQTVPDADIDGLNKKQEPAPAAAAPAAAAPARAP